MYDEEKFQSFNDMLDDAKMNRLDAVMVAWPEVLGDDYEEIIENLARLADKGLNVAIAGRKPRGE